MFSKKNLITKILFLLAPPGVWRQFIEARPEVRTWKTLTAKTTTTKSSTIATIAIGKRPSSAASQITFLTTTRPLSTLLRVKIN